MKSILNLVLVFITGILSGCFSSVSKNNNTGINDYITYGAPKAYITKDAIPATSTATIYLK